LEWKPLFRHRPKGDAIDADARAEMETHIELAVEHLVARGMTRDEALVHAHARFGDYATAEINLIASATDRERQVDRREYRHELMQDVRLALRHFRRAPFFFGAAILTLAIGIGANGAVFSILRASLMQDLPYRSPEELVMLWRGWESDPVSSRGGLIHNSRGINVAPTLTSWRREFGDVGEIAGILAGSGNMEARFDLASRDGTEQLQGAAVTPNFFSLLGVTPALGRLISEADAADAAPVAVLSYATWQHTFGADSGIVGKPVTLTYGRGRTRVARTLIVIGVLPKGFRFTYPAETQLWTLRPWAALDADEPNAILYHAVIRLKAGVTLAQVSERLSVLSDREYPDDPRPVGQRTRLLVEPIHEWIVGEVRPAMYLIGSVAALLLLITCATVSNGLLVRASARSQEIAVRVAIGAGRWRLVRQLLTEGVLLSLAGALAGTVLAAALQPVLRALIPSSVPLVGDITLNLWTIAFGVAMAGITTVLAALAPAWSGTKVDVSAALTRSATASSTRHAVRSRQMLVAAQAAVAASLLLSATLLLTSLFKLGRVPLGFDGQDVLTVEMRLTGPKYADASARAHLQDDLLERVRAIPGVAEAGMTTAVPFRGNDVTGNVRRFGTDQGFKGNFRWVDSAYFNVLRISLVKGRLFNSGDRAGGERVVVVSEAFARNALPPGDPVGQTFDWDGPTRVIGVVRDIRYHRFTEDATPAVYFLRTQEPPYLVCVVLRADVDVASVARGLRRAARDADPSIPAMRMTTIDHIVAESIADRRFYTVATAMFASIALLLTIAGLVVVVSRAVTERKRELAIRAALGATVRELIRVASRDALVAVVIGLVVGLGVAYNTSRLLQQFLFEIEPQSPASFATVGVLLIAVALSTAWGAAKRVSQLPLTRVISAD
jgi:putative ABC transport system permease protein